MLRSHIDGIGPPTEAREDWERMYVEIAEAIGYVNRAEGGEGYAVADHATVLETVRRFVRADGELCDLRERVRAFLETL